MKNLSVSAFPQHEISFVQVEVGIYTQKELGERLFKAAQAQRTKAKHNSI